jgi:MFS family permease
MGTALGITSAGIGVGIFLVVPACQWLIDHVGWRWAFRIAGAVIAAWVIPAAIWIVKDPPRPAHQPSPSREEGLDLRAALGTRRFWLLGLANSANGFANQMLLVHQVAYLVDHGIAALLAASVVGVVGVTSIAGKAGGGWISDHVDRRATYSFATVAVAASVGMLGLLALAPSPAWAYLYAVLIGLGYSVPAAITPALVSDRFQGRHFGSIFGALQVIGAVGGSLGPWVAGRIFDATGSYAPAFVGAVGAAALATASLWLTGHGRARVAS